MQISWENGLPLPLSLHFPFPLFCTFLHSPLPPFLLFLLLSNCPPFFISFLSAPVPWSSLRRHLREQGTKENPSLDFSSPLYSSFLSLLNPENRQVPSVSVKPMPAEVRGVSPALPSLSPKEMVRWCGWQGEGRGREIEQSPSLHQPQTPGHSQSALQQEQWAAFPSSTLFNHRPSPPPSPSL